MRPEARLFLLRQRETFLALAAAALCLWIATRGGWFLAAIGGAGALVCVVWARAAWRRQRFARKVESPGLVELVEGRIGYFGGGTTLGGYVALDDLAEIRLVPLGGARFWRLKTKDGQALLVPTAAEGAEALHDAFAALPGIEMGRLLAALDQEVPPAEVGPALWSRPGMRSAPGPVPLR